jgi:hypothetical protein
LAPLFLGCLFDDTSFFVQENLDARSITLTPEELDELRTIFAPEKVRVCVFECVCLRVSHTLLLSRWWATGTPTWYVAYDSES